MIKILRVNQSDYRLALLCNEEENKIEIRRVFGNMPEIAIPDSFIDSCGKNCRITIGNYCFSGVSKLLDEEKSAIEAEGLGDGTEPAINSELRPVNGDYLEKIELPDEVTALGDYCFYNCKKLREICVSSNLSEIGSDAFMNCKKIKKIQIRASVRNKTGLMQLLAQISGEVEIIFDEASFLFPEFSESYDLIGPAHIFSLNLEGEGYRARKQFIDGVFDINGYDSIFAKACNEERFKTLMKMAVSRLTNPYALADEARKAYEKYVCENEENTLRELVNEGEREIALGLLASGIISDRGRQAAIEAAVSSCDTELITRIISGEYV